MAITVVRSAQSAGGANANSIAVTPAAGNTLVSMAAQSGSQSAPAVAGCTVNSTPALYNTTDSVWVATKIADGTETTIGWTPASGGTMRGVCYWEVAGAAAVVTLDGSPQHTDNLSALTGGVAYTTGVAGSIILIGVGQNANSGTIGSWTGTNVATNISTTGSRCFGGSFITTVTVSSTFTANWANSHVAGILAIALQPPVVASGLLPRTSLLGAG